MKVLLVSIGTLEKARGFVEKTGFPAENLFADGENATYDALQLKKGARRTFFSADTAFAMLERFKKDGAADLVNVLKNWDPWTPPKAEQALNQGGTFLFDGEKCIWCHYDRATSDHADKATIVSEITNGRAKLDS